MKSIVLFTFLMTSPQGQNETFSFPDIFPGKSLPHALEPQKSKIRGSIWKEPESDEVKPVEKTEDNVSTGVDSMPRSAEEFKKRYDEINQKELRGFRDPSRYGVNHWWGL